EVRPGALSDARAVRAQRTQTGGRDEPDSQSGRQEAGEERTRRGSGARNQFVLPVARPVLQRFLRQRLQTGGRRDSLLRTESRLLRIGRDGGALSERRMEVTPGQSPR